MTARLVQARRVYDHRLRDEVRRNGTVAQHHRLHLPRSTAATWRSRGPGPWSLSGSSTDLVLRDLTEHAASAGELAGHDADIGAAEARPTC
jgi:hypothetical protein